MDLTLKPHQDIFEKFLCTIGRDFYDLPVQTEKFTLTRQPSIVRATQTINEVAPQIIKPLPLGLSDQEEVVIEWSLSLL